MANLHKMRHFTNRHDRADDSKALPAHDEAEMLRAELAAANARAKDAEQREKEFAGLYEHERAAHTRTEADLKALADCEQVYKTISETFRFGIWTSDADGTPQYVSKSLLELLNLGLEELQQHMARQMQRFDKSRAVLHPEDAEGFRNQWLKSMKTGEDFSVTYRVIDRNGKIHTVRTKGRAIRDERGRINSWAGSNLDITELRQEQEELRQRADIMRELSTPVLEISAGLLIVPLIGPLWSQRAKELTKQLLDGVRRTRAKAVVIDVTGVPNLDTKVANHLIRTAEACRLLGAKVILTGISKAVAQTLTELRVSVTGTTTAGDLRSGIELAHESIEQRRAA